MDIGRRPPFSSDRRWIGIRFRAVGLWIRDKVDTLRSDESLCVVVGLTVVAAVVWMLSRQFPPGSALATALSTILDVLSVILGALLSLDLFERTSEAVDRERLNTPAAVVDFYEERDCAGYFISTAENWPADYTDDIGVPDKLPVVPEARPDKPLPMGEMSVNLDPATFYDLPDRAQTLFEPVLERSADRFFEEGHFNQTKLRPETITGDTISGGQTTFFNNFVINLSADFDIFQSRTPRELLHSEIFSQAGEPRPLSETTLPYIAASSGLVVSKKGETVLPLRGHDVVIQGRMIGESFGGSWDWDIVENSDSPALDQVQTEFESERKECREFGATHYHLGTLRRFDLMGKPDNYLLTCVDGNPDWTEGSDEHEFSIATRIVPEGVTVTEPADLLKHSDHVVERILSAVYDSGYQPSLGLLAWIWLFGQHASDQQGRE